MSSGFNVQSVPGRSAESKDRVFESDLVIDLAQQLTYPD
jgi:hypothetical protein